MRDAAPSNQTSRHRTVTRETRVRGKPYPPPDALVAILNSKRDLALARDEGWYRVPAAHAPAALTNGSIRTLALYLPKEFGADAFQVVYAAPVLGMTTQPRRELLPDEPLHPRADQPYLRVALGALSRLARPIPSQRLRRLVFIATTQTKLRRAQEINDLFHDSPLEDRVWDALQAAGITAERQYYVSGDDKGMYALDFAIFCQERNLDVECDGDRWHANPTRARGDNRRNNYLGARGWSVLRFSTADVEQDLPHVLREVRQAMHDCGGPASPAPDDAPALPPGHLWQHALWESAVASGQPVDPHIPAPRSTRRRGGTPRKPARTPRGAKGSAEALSTPSLFADGDEHQVDASA